MGDDSASKGHQLTNLQAGRAVAAFAVVLVHASMSLPAFGQALPETLSHLFSFGFLGVDFFFVLSGFIISYQHGADDRSWPAARRYLTKRLLRIYVPYLPIAIGLLILFMIAPSLAGAGRNWGLLTSLTLLPSPAPSVISISWTMVHELAFYVIFLGFYFVPRFELIVAAWVVAIVALWLGGYRAPEFGNDWPEVFFAPINLEFVGGIVAARFVPLVSPRAWPLLLGAGLCLLFDFFVFGENRVLFGTGTVAIVLAIVLLEATGRGSPRWLLQLGNASYAVYLLHLTVFSIVLRLTAPFGNWLVGLAVSVVAVAVVGLGYHHLFERPALAAGRRWLIPARQPALA